MVTLQEVERQLKAIGISNTFWGRPEMLELQHILIPGEMVKGFINGWHQGGFASLAVTDQRILLIDKKLFRLSVEDLRYDMVSEVDFSSQVLSGIVQICTPTKKLVFKSMKPQQLRDLAGFIQHRVIEIRQQFGAMQPEAPVPEPAQAQNRPYPRQAPFIDPRYPQEDTPSPIAQQLVPDPENNALPVPRLARNPYATTPVMMRRRIGRFGSLGQVATGSHGSS